MTDKNDYYKLGKYPNFDKLCELMRERREAQEPRPISESSYKPGKYPNFDKLCDNIRNRVPEDEQELFEEFAGEIENRISVQEAIAKKESR